MVAGSTPSPALRAPSPKGRGGIFVGARVPWAYAHGYIRSPLRGGEGRPTVGGFGGVGRRRETRAELVRPEPGGVAADHLCAAVPTPGYGLASLRDEPSSENVPHGKLFDFRMFDH